MLGPIYRLMIQLVAPPASLTHTMPGTMYEGREPPRYLPMTAQHSPAFGQQLPEPGGHVVGPARRVSVGGARLELADKAGEQLAGDGDLADRRGRGLSCRSHTSGPVT